MKVLYLNVLDGCPEDRFDKIVSFVKEQNPDVLGLSELNDWQKNDFEKLKSFKEQTGYSEHIFCETETGYNLGLFSKQKFIKTFSTAEGFWHGLVMGELEFSDKKITFLLTHLCPKTEDMRLKDLETIKKLDLPEKVVFMGDMNSLSDQDDYDEEKLIKEMKERSVTKFGVDKLRKEIIPEIKRLGFVDAVRVFSKDFEFSVPTPLIEHKDHISKLRLDYIFVKNLEPTNAKIIRNEITEKLSDHYPVVAEFDSK